MPIIGAAAAVVVLIIIGGVIFFVYSQQQSLAPNPLRVSSHARESVARSLSVWLKGSVVRGFTVYHDTIGALHD